MDSIVILILFTLAVVVNLVGEGRNSNLLKYYSKPLLMPLLSFFYWIETPVINYTVIIALWLAFTGDVLLLLSHRKIFFILGLVSFLACQVCYIIYFAVSASFPSDVHPLFWLVLLVYIAGGIFIFIKLKNSLEEMKLPVIIYMAVVLFMSFVCAARGFSYQGAAFWLPLAGSLLFILSDTILAFNHFKRTVPYSGVYVMSSYLAAQIMIVLGIMAEQF